MNGKSDEPITASRICLSPFLQTELEKDSLGEKLQVMIASLPAGAVTLAEIRDLVGQDGLLLLTIFLTLFFMVPIQIPGLSVVFGSAIVMIAVSRLRGRYLWLPERIAQRLLSADKVRLALSKSSIWLQRLEQVSRPHRLDRLASSGLADILNNSGLITGALLLMAPIILIPFSNTLPGLALLFLCIGLLQRDGLCILLGHFVNLATIIYFSFLMVSGGVAIHETIHHLKGQADERS